MTIIDPREERLPRWAQHSLGRERVRREDAELKLAAHLDTVEKSRIWFGDYGNPIYIPEPHGYQTVYFSPNGSDSSFDQIGVTIRDGGIEIQGGNTMSIELQSSNFFHARFSEWRR